MIIRTVGADGDWNFGKGLSDYARDEDAVEQNVRSRVRSWVGNCFFALSEGVDWKGRLDVGQQEALKNEVQSIILRSFGVISVDNLEVVFQSDTRLFTVQCSIQTIFSDSFQTMIRQAAGQSGT